MSVLDSKIPVYRIFEEITAIPHGSYNESGLADYIVAFAQRLNLRYYRDETNNVVVYKAASTGRENDAPLMLQCHIDMVCEKVAGSTHDFKKDPLSLKLDGDILRADGTTLGADNGTGASFILAILEDENVSHPALECVFTTMEEVGMLGATALREDVITAKRLIGLDGAGELGTCVSSAGGLKVHITRSVSTAKNCGETFRLKISGLLGGHSGIMIDKGHANSDKLGFRILLSLIRTDPMLRVVSLTGGLKDNGIPTDFDCTFSSECSFEAMEELVRELRGNIVAEYAESDPGITIELIKGEAADTAVTVEDSAALIKLGYLLPDGVKAMSQKLKIPNASVNMGLCRLNEDNIEYRLSMRSPFESMKASIVDEIMLVCSLFDAKAETEGNYPGWAFAEHSPLLDTFKQMFAERGQDVFVGAVHGGLEAGIWKGRYPEMDIITYGPLLFDCHTPSEWLDIASFKRSYDNLVELIGRI